MNDEMYQFPTGFNAMQNGSNYQLQGQNVGDTSNMSLNYGLRPEAFGGMGNDINPNNQEQTDTFGNLNKGLGALGNLAKGWASIQSAKQAKKQYAMDLAFSKANFKTQANEANDYMKWRQTFRNNVAANNGTANQVQDTASYMNQNQVNPNITV